MVLARPGLSSNSVFLNVLLVMTDLPVPAIGSPENSTCILARTIVRRLCISSARLLRRGFFPALLCAAAQARGALPPQIADELIRADLPQDSVAIWVQPVDSERPTLTLNADIPMNPASVMKLVTSFAALDMLGPAYTWRTRFAADAPPGNGVLDGNLYVVGGGDPVFGYDRLWRVLRQLKDLGVNEIRGDIVLDRSAWNLPPFDPGAFDGKPMRPYNAGADALLLNFNALRLTFVPAERGGPPRLTADPPIAGLVVDNALRTENGPCGEWDDRLDAQIAPDGASTRLTIRGAWRDSCGRRDWHVVPLSPAAYDAGLIEALWRELGGRLSGRAREGTTPEGTATLLEETSPPLGDVVRDMNKWSNNVQARILLASIGAAGGGTPDTVSAGARTVRLRLAAMGIGVEGLEIENGSGLSRTERITAHSLGQLLEAAWRQPWMPEFISSMAMAGVDGTARKRLRDSPARGFAHIKTGTLNGARAMAGYVLDSNGRRHVVVMLVNHPNAWASRAAQDTLLEWVWMADNAASPATTLTAVPLQRK